MPQSTTFPLGFHLSHYCYHKRFNELKLRREFTSIRITSGDGSLKPRIWLSLLLSELSLLGLTGCNETSPPEPRLIPVKVAKPLIQDVSQYMLINGRSEESATFEVRARVEGKLEAANFREGGLVLKEQLLFQIEKEPFVSDMNAAQAQLEAAKAQVDSVKAQKQTADAHYNAAEAAHNLALAELQRTQTLFDQNVATQSELDLRKAQEKVALADTDTADAARNDADAALKVAKAAIQREVAVVEQAGIQLGYTTIHSEIDGLAGEILIDPGNLIGKGENTLLTTIRQIDPLDIYFEAPERMVLSHLRRIYEGRREKNQDVVLEVQFEGETGYPHKGSLDLVDNRIDPLTGTTLLRGKIRNPYKGEDEDGDRKIPYEERQYLLRPGAYAKIRVKTDPIPEALLIHETAIGTDLSGKYILIVNQENVVEQRRVRLGQLYHGFRHIEAMWDPNAVEPQSLDDAEPITPDLQYVLEGLIRVRPGVKVKTEEVKLTYPQEDSEKTVSSEMDSGETPESNPPDEN